jgi:hypothetical protein
LRAAGCFLLAYSSTRKMEAKYFLKTSADFQRTTLCYIPEDRTAYRLMALGNRALKRTLESNGKYNEALVEVPTAVTMKRTASWTVTLYSSETVGRFGIRSFRIEEKTKTRNHQKQPLSFPPASAGFLPWFSLRPWRQRRYISPIRRALSELHGVTTRKIVLFRLTAVGISNPVAYKHIHQYWNSRTLQKNPVSATAIGFCNRRKTMRSVGIVT